MFCRKRTIKKSIFFAILFISMKMTGCDNILTMEPHNAISSTQYFKNGNEVDQAVIGIYAKLQDMYNNQYIFTEVRSDNTINQFNDANRGPHPIWLIDEFTNTPSNVYMEPYWQDIYQGIQRANTVLNNIGDVQFENSDLKDQLTGEAKFLRAFYYFDLVRLFGDIPLVLDQIKSPDAAFASLDSRTDVEKVYQQIIKDVKDAAGLLPQTYSSSNKGRATEGAARTLLSVIYLTRKNYSEARNELENVKNLGYALLPNYADLFNPDNKYNQEAIFDVSYAELESNLGLGSTFIYDFAPHNSGSEVTGDNAHNPTGLNIPTESILQSYENGDNRKNASIGYYINPDNTQYGIAIGDTIPYVKKFVHPHSVRGVTNDNWPVYRYAQVLLMLSETINEMDGPTSEAYSYINQVRQRAGLGPLPSGLSQSQFRDAVYHEERVELAFENHRWFSLLRTGRAKNVMTEHAKEVKDLQPHLVNPVYEIEDYKLLYPIPARELTLNPDLKQNPGY